mgnify:FL=1
MFHPSPPLSSRGGQVAQRICKTRPEVLIKGARCRLALFPNPNFCQKKLPFSFGTTVLKQDRNIFISPEILNFFFKKYNFFGQFLFDLALACTKCHDHMHEIDKYIVTSSSRNHLIGRHYFQI